MSFLLHFSGPADFEQTVALKQVTPAVVVGRDKEAAVYLPDAERLVSRRHLSIVWSEAGARLQVLSGNGINTDHGDYFAGDEVVLADGESARVGSYSLIVSAEPAATDLDATSFAGMGTRPLPAGPVTLSAPEKEEAAQEKDPWAELLAQNAPRPQAETLPGRAAPAAQAAPPAAGLVPDDPFSSSTSWRIVDDMGGPDPFSISFVGRSGVDLPMEPPAPPAPAPTSVAAAATAPMGRDASLQALCRGLGVQPPAGDTDFDWEQFGSAVRQVVQCLGDHLGARMGARRDMRAQDRTLLGARENNPLRSGLPPKDMLHYLLFTPDGVGGYVPPGQALQEVAEDARSHEAALRAAARSLAEGAISEFDPAKLRGPLLKGRLSMTTMVDNARLWDLYTAHYEQKSQQLPEWAEQLFNRYYMSAFLREVEKLRRARLPAAAKRAD